jgi:hypothetical protein
LNAFEASLQNVGRLHPSTTEEAITQKLAGAIDALSTDFKCVKILAKDVQSPTYISFKIGMSDESFKKSLEPSIWPLGVAFCEFVYRPRRNFRRSGFYNNFYKHINGSLESRNKNNFNVLDYKNTNPRFTLP